MQEMETFAKIVGEMSSEEKNTEYDYIGIVASRLVGEKSADVLTEVSENGDSDIAMLGRLEALGLALGFTHAESADATNKRSKADMCFLFIKNFLIQVF